MMAAERLSPSTLIERLPQVRGRLSADAPLHKITWFRVGGPAEVLFRPEDRADLLHFLTEKPKDIPVTVLGVASNLLVRDGGLPGVALRLARGFTEIERDGDAVIAGAGAPDLNVARTAQGEGLGGLEFLSGVPGTIGGALRMNAGAYGTEIGDVLDWAEAVQPDGTLRRFTAAEMEYGYRHCGLPGDWIFLRARLRGTPDAPDAIARRIAEIQAQRGDSQPVKSRTGGSTFKNPAPEVAGGLRAWELIDRAGCRGLTVGGAQVSEMHCNFLINTGEASAADLESLGEEVRRRVKQTSGVTLEWEIRRIGVPQEGVLDGSIPGKEGSAA